MNTTINEKIAVARKNKNLTQTDLARRVSISPQMVSKWECGESLPDVVTIGKLAEIFGVPVNYFFDGEGQQTADKPEKTKNRAKFNDHKWIEKDFSKTTIKDISFACARFVKCNFAECDMSNNVFSCTEFVNCNIAKANFKRAKFPDADLINCDLSGAIFDGAAMKNTDFKNCVFKNCNFVNIVFDDCKFKKCVFENCTADKISYNFLLVCKADVNGISVK
jgi:uncharacterized protein YjbI with pentapeptide repeats